MMMMIVLILFLFLKMLTSYPKAFRN